MATIKAKTPVNTTATTTTATKNRRIEDSEMKIDRLTEGALPYFRSIFKQIEYLGILRKTESQDNTHKWIGTYNTRQMILNKFFKWLYNNQDEPDHRKWISPPFIQGTRQLPRKEKKSHLTNHLISGLSESMPYF